MGRNASSPKKKNASFLCEWWGNGVRGDEGGSGGIVWGSDQVKEEKSQDNSSPTTNATLAFAIARHNFLHHRFLGSPRPTRQGLGKSLV